MKSYSDSEALLLLSSSARSKQSTKEHALKHKDILLECIAQGMSARDIADKMNSADMRTITGKQWNDDAVYRLKKYLQMLYEESSVVGDD